MKEYVCSINRGQEFPTIISFSPINTPEGLFSPYRIVMKAATNLLFVNDTGNRWYQNGIEDIAEDSLTAARKMVEEARSMGNGRVVTFGTSMGAYGALLFAALGGADGALVFGAETILNTPGSRSAAHMLKTIDVPYPDLAPVLKDCRPFPANLFICESDEVDMMAGYHVHDINTVTTVSIKGMRHPGIQVFNLDGSVGSMLTEFATSGKIPVGFPRQGNLLKDWDLVNCLYEGYQTRYVEKDRVRWLAHMTAVAERWPEEAMVQLRLGEALYANRDHKGAESAWRTSLELCPFQYEALALLGEMLRKKGLSEEAAAYLEKSVAVHRGHGPGHYSLGKICMDSGDLKKAEWHFRKALQTSPENKDFQSSLSELLLRTSNSKPEKVNEIKKMESILPSSPPAVNPTVSKQAQTPVPDPLSMNGRYHALIRKESSRDLLVVFSHLGRRPPSFAWYKTLQALDVNLLFVNCEGYEWYRGGIKGLGGATDINSTLVAIRSISRRIDPNCKVFMAGGSMGGYGALLYGALYGADAIFASAAELILGLPGGKSEILKRDEWSNVYPDLRLFSNHNVKRHLIYGTMFLVDTLCASLYQSAAQTIVYSVNGAEHDATDLLTNQGQFVSSIQRMIEGHPEILDRNVYRPGLASLDLGQEYWRLNALIAEKQWKQALPLAHKLLGLHHNEPLMYFLVGTCYFSTANHKAAREFFLKSAELCPAHANTFLHLGVSEARLHLFDEAAEHLKSAIALNGLRSMPYFQLGILYESTGDRKNATACFKKALDINPANVMYASKLKKIADALA